MKDIMSDNKFLQEYFDLYRESIFDETMHSEIIAMKNAITACSDAGNKVIFVGNGGSAGIASHASVDFTKQCGITSINFNEAGLITCFANDYGYEHWVAKALEAYAEAGDVVVMISVSGKSLNLVNAAKYAQSAGIKVISLTGQNPDNPLNKNSDIKLWVNSKAYNIVECTHQIWILTVCDMIIGKAEYSV